MRGLREVGCDRMQWDCKIISAIVASLDANDYSEYQLTLGFVEVELKED